MSEKSERVMANAAMILRTISGKQTDRDKLVERLSGPHEWGYRCIADGAFIADDAPFVAAAHIQADAATIADLVAALKQTVHLARAYSSGTGSIFEKAMTDAERLADRAALKGGNHD